MSRLGAPSAVQTTGRASGRQVRVALAARRAPALPVERGRAGTLLAPGRRTVAAALRVLGLAQGRRFERYHRVLSRARWSGLAVSRVRLRVLVGAFVPRGPLVLGVDETVERRRGRRSRPRGSPATRCAPAARTS
jgi:hypothetical protein